MASFFRSRGYPSAQEWVSAIPLDAIISERSGVTGAQATIPLMLTYYPTNAVVRNIITRKFHLLRDDPDTRDIYRPLRVLCAYRRDNNLRDFLVRSHLDLRSTRQTNTNLPRRRSSSPGHSSTDMLVSVIHSGFRDTQNRRLLEARMIFKHKMLHPGGLNTDFAFL